MVAEPVAQPRPSVQTSEAAQKRPLEVSCPPFHLKLSPTLDQAGCGFFQLGNFQGWRLSADCYPKRFPRRCTNSSAFSAQGAVQGCGASGVISLFPFQWQSLYHNINFSLESLIKGDMKELKGVSRG